jgi:hypothetical protein
MTGVFFLQFSPTRLFLNLANNADEFSRIEIRSRSPSCGRLVGARIPRVEAAAVLGA